MPVSARDVRVVTGALTAVYGLAVLTRPRTLLSPAALPNTTSERRLARAIGVRDVCSGVFLVAAPDHLATAAVAARVTADASDVVVFGARCPRGTKLKAASIAAGWGAVCALGQPGAFRDVTRAATSLARRA